MGRGTKICLWVGAFLILTGCILCISAALANNMNWEALSTMKPETNEYELTESFQNISIISDTADIQFIATENTVCKVICHEQVNIKHRVNISEGTLTVEKHDTRKWYEYIGIYFRTPKITVYLPKGTYGTLSVKGSTGDMEIPSDFQFESMDISISTGHVTSHASTTGNMRIKTSTGSIHLENASANTVDLQVTTGKINAVRIACHLDMTVSVSTGTAELAYVHCRNFTSTGSTGDLSMKNVVASETFSIGRTTGDVKLNSCDAAELAIETGTGDVKGTLQSEKVFITKTSTGHIDIPDTVSGGTCKITTSTGDINIQIIK